MKPFVICVIAFCAQSAWSQESVPTTRAAESAPVARLTAFVQDATGAPIAGARCEVFENSSAIEDRSQEGELLESAVSDSEGHAVFESRRLRSVLRHLLKVTHAEYLTERRPFTPEAGGLVSRVKLGRGLPVAGSVVTAVFQPIEGATVTIIDLHQGSVDPNGSTERVAVTDAKGRYTAPHLRSGLKRVVVSARGYATTTIDAMTVEAAPIDDLDFTMPAAARISGRFTARDTGAPVTGVWVTAHRLVGETQGRTLARATRVCVRTGQDGSYAFDVAPGAWIVCAQAAGWVSPPQRTVDAGSTRVDVELERLASIRGRVVDDVTGAPLRAFDLTLVATPYEVFPPRYLKRRFCDLEKPGTFDFNGVNAGRRWFLAQAPGYAVGLSPEIDVKRGEPVDGVEIRMVRGATVTGRVRDAQGTPIAGASVVLGPPPPSDCTVSRGGCFMPGGHLTRDLPVTRTDASGAYALPRLRGGVYVLSVKHPGLASHRGELFEVPAAGSLAVPDVVLSPGATIRGRVKLLDGSPDAKAMVKIAPTAPTPDFSGHRIAYTDAHGRFEVAELAPGEYRVLVLQRNGEPDLSSLFTTLENPNVFTLSEGEVKELDL